MYVVRHSGRKGRVCGFGLGNSAESRATSVIVVVGIRVAEIDLVLGRVEVAGNGRLELALLAVLRGRGRRHVSGEGCGSNANAAGEYAVCTLRLWARPRVGSCAHALT